MALLKNIEVEYVSLVDKAAVRDPSDPEKPQRFLLWKSDSHEPEAPMKTTKKQKKVEKVEKVDPYAPVGTYADLRKRAGELEARLAKRAVGDSNELAMLSPAAAAMWAEHHPERLEPIEKDDGNNGRITDDGAASDWRPTLPRETSERVADEADDVMRTAPRGERFQALLELGKRK